jgi:hypothetical protein
MGAERPQFSPVWKPTTYGGRTYFRRIQTGYTHNNCTNMMRELLRGPPLYANVFPSSYPGTIVFVRSFYINDSGYVVG